MAGQAHHFANYATEKLPYAIKRFIDETGRLYGVLDLQLRSRPYVAGDYSIADMAIYPWVALHEMHQQDLGVYPAIRRWFDGIGKRPAVQRGMALMQDMLTTPIDDEARNILFGQQRRR